MRYALVCIPLALAACSLKADYTGTLYACDPNGMCPGGFLCIEDRCVPTEPQAATGGARLHHAGKKKTQSFQGEVT